MITLFICYGLPGSGKDRWARSYMQEHSKTKRVNKDDIRALSDIAWSKKNEEYTLDIRNHLVRKGLMSGYDIIVSDTNFPIRGIHYQTLCNIARQVGDVMVIEKFFDISLEDALIANKGPNRVVVPDEVIVNMYNKYIKDNPILSSDDTQWRKENYYPNVKHRYTNNYKLPNAIICDLDGTLAHMNPGRSPYNPTDEEVMMDIPDQAVRNILLTYQQESWIAEWNISDGSVWRDKPITELIFISGRFGKFRNITEEWLKERVDYSASFFKQYGIKLFMRPDDDQRKDSIVKKEIYEREIKGKYNVLFVLDDRDSVVEMWRNEGLKVLQCNYGSF